MKYQAIMIDGSTHDLAFKDKDSLVLSAKNTYLFTKSGELLYTKHIVRIKPTQESGDFNIETRGTDTNE